jgi:large subunit ribosomal protein L18
MNSKKTTTSTFRRQLRHTRCRKKIKGSADRPRLAVFISNQHAYTQIIDDVSGRTLCACSTMDKDLRDAVKGKPMTEVTAVIGKTIAGKAKESGIESIVFDRAGYKYGRRMQALCDAARKAGLAF